MSVSSNANGLRVCYSAVVCNCRQLTDCIRSKRDYVSFHSVSTIDIVITSLTYLLEVQERKFGLTLMQNCARK